MTSSPRAGVTVRLRAATPDDLPAVASIEREAFSDPWSARSFAAALARPEVHFLVAEPVAATATSVVGYLVAWFLGDEGEIGNVAVEAASRGRGIGAALLDGALSAARSRAVHALFLEVRESNVAARALYASRGFVEVGRRRRYYRAPDEDALVLRCDVAPAR
jgi:ribosomal-protein-alanine N-acetyltransferase